MIQFIELLLINTLFIWGLNFCFKKDQIFGFAALHREISWKIPVWVWKPIFGCCACMSSVWGTIGFVIFSHSFGIHAIMYPIYLLCLVGLNHIITALIYDME